MVALRVPPYEPSEVLESGTELLSGMSEIPRLQFHCNATDLHVDKLISSWFVVFPVFPVQIYQSSILAEYFQLIIFQHILVENHICSIAVIKFLIWMSNFTQNNLNPLTRITVGAMSYRHNTHSYFTNLKNVLLFKYSIFLMKLFIVLRFSVRYLFRLYGNKLR